MNAANRAGDDRLNRTIVLIGYRGSGKTVVGRRLAKRLGWEHVDLDELIQAAAGLTIGQLFERHGESYFRSLETRSLAERLDRCHGDNVQPIVLSVGGGAILAPASRKLIRRAGHCVWLVAPAEDLARRIGDDPQSADDRPALTSLDPRDEVETILRERTPLYEQTAHCRVDTAGRTVEQVVEAVMSALAGLPADVHGSTA